MAGSLHRGILEEFFLQALTYNSVCNLKDKVSSLIENNCWNIPDHIRRHILQVVNIIEDMEIGGGSDEVVWAPSKGGNYTLRDTCEFMRRKKAPWEWHSLVWHKNRIPKHAFISWMALKGGLKTLQKMKTWGVVQSETCVLCWGNMETEQHPFYDYLVAKTVWRGLKSNMEYGRGLSQSW